MQAAATLVLGIHLAWILWVILGALFTRGHPVLTAFHLASLVWGIIVELSSLPCPLTITEQWMETLAGVSPYHGGFLLHCLDATVYPNLSEALLVSIGVAVCVLNLLIYGRRFWVARRGRSVT